MEASLDHPLLKPHIYTVDRPTRFLGLGVQRRLAGHDFALFLYCFVIYVYYMVLHSNAINKPTLLLLPLKYW